ncbi:MAG: hypothetical protein BWY50_02015 [Spirochaetes bacterium ADurb.Bin315]|nr:MAG: hypothetical protein BWY50_02015 [Spirochaetes bacterium ADurb.Bin315]
MRVAFQRRTVHVRAGVALVSVAHDIFHVVFDVFGEVPLHPRREARTAAATEAGRLELIDDIIARQLEESSFKSVVAVSGDILVDVLRIDRAAVTEHDSELLLVELNVFHLGVLLRQGLVIQKPLDLSPFDDVLGDQFLCVGRFDLHIEGIFRQYLDDRSLFAESETTGLDDLHVIGKAVGFALFNQFLVDCVGFARLTCRTAANQDVVFKCHYLPPSCLMISAAGRSNIWSVTRRFPRICSFTILRATSASTFP